MHLLQRRSHVKKLTPRFNPRHVKPLPLGRGNFPSPGEEGSGDAENRIDFTGSVFLGKGGGGVLLSRARQVSRLLRNLISSTTTVRRGQSSREGTTPPRAIPSSVSVVKKISDEARIYEVNALSITRISIKSAETQARIMRAQSY